MANRLTKFGNDLYTGARSIDFVGGRKLWYIIASIVTVASIVIPLIGGIRFSIEFRGGSQCQITSVKNATTEPAIKAVAQVVSNIVPQVTTVGQSGVRVQTDQLTSEETRSLPTALASAYQVQETDVAS